MMTLQRQIDELLEHDPPLNGILEPLNDSYLVSVGVIDQKHNVLLLRFRYSQNYPDEPPRLTLRLNEASSPFKPVWAEEWNPAYTLGQLIDMVIDQFS
jgi:hypothetical protein